jgi:hypothetical protein
MASTMDTSIVKLRTSFNGCLPFKANDRENKSYVGISRIRRYRMVDICKGKRKIWLRGTDDVLVVGLHMVGKKMKVSSLNNVTSFLALYFFFHLIHPSHIFFATPLLYFSSFSFSITLFHSHIHIYIFFLYFSIFLYFFSIHIFFFLLSISRHLFYLFKALNSSLSCIYIIWILK